MSIPPTCRCGHSLALHWGECRGGQETNARCACLAFDAVIDPKAQAWDECCNAFAWALVNGPAGNALDYVSKNNPYAKDLP